MKARHSFLSPPHCPVSPGQKQVFNFPFGTHSRPVTGTHSSVQARNPETQAVSLWSRQTETDSEILLHFGEKWEIFKVISYLETIHSIIPKIWLET